MIKVYEVRRSYPSHKQTTFPKLPYPRFGGLSWPVAEGRSPFPSFPPSTPASPVPSHPPSLPRCCCSS